MTKLPPALQEALEADQEVDGYDEVGLQIVREVRPTGRQKRDRARAMAAALRWHMHDAECWEDAEAILAVLEQEAKA